MIGIDLDVARDFLIALLIGALVGVEREKSQSASGHRTIAGLRTFILLAQLGSLAAWASMQYGGPALYAVALALVGLAVISGHVLESRVRPDAPGLSTEFAALTVFLLGGVVMYGHAEVAVALGILTSAVLAFKQPLHGLVARVATDDIYAVLKLLIASFIVLPLLPNRVIDPLGVLNPYLLWLLVILISGLSLVGYVAVRLLGEAHGTVVTGFAGGLASSTALTLGFARQSRIDPTSTGADALAAGILTAWAVMFVRVIITIAIVNTDLLPATIKSFGALTLVTGLLAAFFYLRGLRRRPVTTSGEVVSVSNPFNLVSAVQFALLFALVLVVVELTRQHAPEGGIYVVSAIAGLTDVNAITLSLAQQASDAAGFEIAARALGIAALANTLVKFLLVAMLGRGPLRLRLAVATGVLFLAWLLLSWFVF
ncbi:MAG: MgtC/SapB family protein [Pseudomonadales bacterium]|jgi:uncharacterized membrane protein (DUF4010 family)|nr:MgtC/SapB family protein [Pseudomonadales bacterium]MCP5319215.1 MgtC/SapB family protein [Pseudomonadales bacterium]MCP5338022.1 MgtC/SapB family protein [Pseudomonadales bacterium]